MSGFLGGGSSANTDRKQTLQGYGQLSNVFNFAMPAASQQQTQGNANTSSGVSDLGSAGAYWQKILSGNRAAMSQAVAPETAQVREASDAQKRQLASQGTARGGGVAGANQQHEDNTRAAIDKIMMGVRPQAASAVTDIGSRKAAVGQQQVSQALNALGLGERASSDLTNSSIDSRRVSLQAHQQAVQNVIGGIEGVMKMFV